MFFICPSFSFSKPVAENKMQIHRVNENARTLSEVALFYYGKSSLWKKIAKWNNLAPPYSLQLNQKLILKLSPQRSEKEGNHLLLTLWRKKFGLSQLRAPLTVPEIQKEVEQIKKFEEAKVKYESKKTEIIYQPTSAEQYFQMGKKFFDEKNYSEALFSFKESRKSDSNFLPPWFYEMKVLRLLKRSTEEIQVKEAFLEKHPQLKNLPFFSKAGTKIP
jgi:tetratricopeptide (TPR) repeat protein